MTTKKEDYLKIGSVYAPLLDKEANDFSYSVRLTKFKDNKIDNIDDLIEVFNTYYYSPAPHTHDSKKIFQNDCFVVLEKMEYKEDQAIGLDTQKYKVLHERELYVIHVDKTNFYLLKEWA